MDLNNGVYSAGNKVMIADNLLAIESELVSKCRYSPGITDEMLVHQGKQATVVSAIDGIYHLDIDKRFYSWVSEFFAVENNELHEVADDDDIEKLLM